MAAILGVKNELTDFKEKTEKQFKSINSKFVWVGEQFVQVREEIQQVDRAHGVWAERIEDKLIIVAENTVIQKDVTKVKIDEVKDQTSTNANSVGSLNFRVRKLEDAVFA